MNKYLKQFLFVALIALVFTATGAYAEGDGVFVNIQGRLLDAFQNVRNVIFIVGGFGLIGLGFAAIFGKVKWPWLAALACGLAIVALAGALVEYVTDGSTNTDIADKNYEFGDTFIDGGGN